jgi:S-methylmethionine-dependent homocysteine/selenocysteine methylase
MSKYRHSLPQLSDKLFLTDGGLETTLVFHEKMDLPHFAAFDLMTSLEGRAKLRAYFLRYLKIAAERRTGFVLEAPTWRASRDWADKFGYSAAELADVNRASIEMLAKLRAEHETPQTPIVISGCVGPRGDGYKADARMSVPEAERYHSEQIRVFAKADADMITAITMNYVEEAIGIVRAAEAVRMPVAISFTVETDGRLPTGESLKEAILAVERATGGAPAYYMINCAHPSHFAGKLDADESWVKRIRGLRANASRRSHAELDAATELDAGNPAELGGEYRELLRKHPHINVLGGCCGTDHRHVAAIARSCATEKLRAAYAA